MYCRRWHCPIVYLSLESLFLLSDKHKYIDVLYLVYLILLHVPAVQFSHHQTVVLHKSDVQYLYSCVCRIIKNNCKFILKAHKEDSNDLNLRENAVLCHWVYFEVFFTDFRVKFNKTIISKIHWIAIREKFFLWKL